jgi:hypothetical protein
MKYFYVRSIGKAKFLFHIFSADFFYVQHNFINLLCDKQLREKFSSFFCWRALENVKWQSLKMGSLISFAMFQYLMKAFFFSKKKSTRQPAMMETN